MYNFQADNCRFSLANIKKYHHWFEHLVGIESETGKYFEGRGFNLWKCPKVQLMDFCFDLFSDSVPEPLSDRVLTDLLTDHLVLDLAIDLVIDLVSDHPFTDLPTDLVIDLVGDLRTNHLLTDLVTDLLTDQKIR